VNDIKRKFGSNVVLILGDWSMCKGHIKGHAPTPNKKYTDVLAMPASYQFRICRKNVF